MFSDLEAKTMNGKVQFRIFTIVDLDKEEVFA